MNNIRSKGHEAYKNLHGTYPEDDGYYHIAELDDNTIIYGKTIEAVDAYIKVQKILNRSGNIITIIMLFIIAPLLMAFIIKREMIWTLFVALAAIILIIYQLVQMGKKCRPLESIYTDKITTIDA